MLLDDVGDNEFLESTGLDGNWEEIGDKIKELNDSTRRFRLRRG